MGLLTLLFGLQLTACSGRAPATITQAAYEDRLRAMWLGAAIANWTGLVTEAARTEPPFYTDDDWLTTQSVPWKADTRIDFVFQDPWFADDDTDIEYVYLHLMAQQADPFLSSEQIAQGWQSHINDHIWVSNASARDLMTLGAQPPVTGMLTVNANGLMIDAQLTTEIFGALAPGMPVAALRLADLPIRTTASGYAAHAAQFHVLLYALASQVDTNLSNEEQILWLVREARRYLPDSSKTATIVDIVLTDYLRNADKNDWERTRDLVFERYHRDASAHGYVYRGWTESSVNFATGLVALLYGQGEYRRTVQIGTLSGWDADNGTATMGGLLGLLYGYDALAAQFPTEQLSDRYQVTLTRDNLPDHLPADPEAEDSFTLMAARMIPLIETTVLAGGGETTGRGWILPELPADPLAHNPLQQLTTRNLNQALAGAFTLTVNGVRPTPNGAKLVDGLEFDFSGREIFSVPEPFVLLADTRTVEIEVLFDRPVNLEAVYLVEGEQGGFNAVELHLLRANGWEAAMLAEEPAPVDPQQPLQIIRFHLAARATVTGFRLTGFTERAHERVELLEIVGLSPRQNESQ